MTNYGANTREQRILRVRTAHGYTREQAIVFLDGWTRGRRAALEAYKREGIRQSRPRVGGEAWAQGQSEAVDEPTETLGEA